MRITTISIIVLFFVLVFFATDATEKYFVLGQKKTTTTQTYLCKDTLIKDIPNIKYHKPEPKEQNNYKISENDTRTSIPDSLQQNKILYMSFDTTKIPRNSEVAYQIYLKTLKNKKEKQTNYHIHTLYKRYDNTFTFGDGDPVPLIVGATISTSRDKTIHHPPKDIPYYLHTFTPSERLSYLQETSHTEKHITNTETNTKSLNNILSFPIKRINKTTACVKTMRKNIGSFGITVPYGNGAYAIAQKDHTNDAYLGESSSDFSSREEVQKTKNHKRDLLDISHFPTETNIIKITRHSNSEAGVKFGHTNIGFIVDKKIWILDPYVQVPGYDDQEPKLREDYRASDRAQEGLAIAKIHYYKSPVSITL